ncbi:hypothetical protein SNEBB_007466 [Seison nebaliae]|nr:hypothetical protein SNEBB_007466 [Seison nebaliae]
MKFPTNIILPIYRKGLKIQYKNVIRTIVSKSEKKIEENVYTIPNALTLTRVALSPLLAYYITKGDTLMASSVFIGGAATDLLDGIIARRWKSQRSAFGSMIDPLADKLFVSSAVFALAFQQLLNWGLVFAVIGRDVLLITAGLYARYISLPEGERRNLNIYFSPKRKSTQMLPTNVSKFNTGMTFLLLMTTIMTNEPQNYLQLATLVTTMASAVSYWRMGRKAIKIF